MMWTFININGNLCDPYVKIITLSIRIKIIILHCHLIIADAVGPTKENKQNRFDQRRKTFIKSYK